MADSLSCGWVGQRVVGLGLPSPPLERRCSVSEADFFSERLPSPRGVQPAAAAGSFFLSPPVPDRKIRFLGRKKIFLPVSRIATLEQFFSSPPRDPISLSFRQRTTEKCWDLQTRHEGSPRVGEDFPTDFSLGEGWKLCSRPGKACRRNSRFPTRATIGKCARLQTRHGGSLRSGERLRTEISRVDGCIILHGSKNRSCRKFQVQIRKIEIVRKSTPVSGRGVREATSVRI